jgi:hypothetical protein
MSHGEACVAAIPGVVDGSLTICLTTGSEISFHVALGADGGSAGQSDRFEFIVGPEHAELIRAALTHDAGLGDGAGTRTNPIPCWIGIHVNS